MIKSIMVLIAGVLMFSVPVMAAECVGVTHPENTLVGKTKLILNGLGVREATIFKVDVYVAALYLKTRSSSGKAILDSTTPKKLALKFVRNVSKDEVSTAWLEGFEKTAGDDLAKLRGRISELNEWMTDMTDGSTLTFTYKNAVLKIEANGEYKGAVPGNDFAKAFFAIWLGPEPPNAGLKSGLLGGSCG